MWLRPEIKTRGAYAAFAASSMLLAGCNSLQAIEPVISPPGVYQQNNTVAVEFVHPTMVGFRCAERGAKFLGMPGINSGACADLTLITMPNPCYTVTSGWYARVLCHELAHTNGWSHSHKGGSLLHQAPMRAASDSPQAIAHANGAEVTRVAAVSTQAVAGVSTADRNMAMALAIAEASQPAPKPSTVDKAPVQTADVGALVSPQNTSQTPALRPASVSPKALALRNQTSDRVFTADATQPRLDWAERAEVESLSRATVAAADTTDLKTGEATASIVDQVSRPAPEGLASPEASPEKNGVAIATASEPRRLAWADRARREQALQKSARDADVSETARVSAIRRVANTAMSETDHRSQGEASPSARSELRPVVSAGSTMEVSALYK